MSTYTAVQEAVAGLYLPTPDLNDGGPGTVDGNWRRMLNVLGGLSQSRPAMMRPTLGTIKGRRAYTGTATGTGAVNGIVNVGTGGTAGAAMTEAQLKTSLTAAIADTTHTYLYYFPAGTYSITSSANQIDLSRVFNVDMLGDGPLLSTITSNVVGYDTVKIGGGSIMIDGLAILQTASTDAAYAVHADCDFFATPTNFFTSVVHNCILQSATKSGIGIGLYDWAVLLLQDSIFSSISANVGDAGIYGHDSVNGVLGSSLNVINCYASSTTGYGLFYNSQGAAGMNILTVKGGEFSGPVADIVSTSNFAPGNTAYGTDITGTCSPNITTNDTPQWSMGPGGPYNGRVWYRGNYAAPISGPVALFFNGTKWICILPTWTYYDNPWDAPLVDYWDADPPTTWKTGVAFTNHGGNTGSPVFTLKDEIRVMIDNDVVLTNNKLGLLNPNAMA